MNLKKGTCSRNDGVTSLPVSAGLGVGGLFLVSQSLNLNSVLFVRAKYGLPVFLLSKDFLFYLVEYKVKINILSF